jgi:hypothetical protein
MLLQDAMILGILQSKSIQKQLALAGKSTSSKVDYRRVRITHVVIER